MEKARFKIAIFNAHNLVLPGVAYYSDREYSQADYDRKLDWMAAQLRRMDADIVAFQEVFHEDAFREVISRSRLYPEAFCYVPEGIQDKLGPLPALVSCLPVLRYGAVARIPPEARLELGGQTLSIKTFLRPVVWAQEGFPINWRSRSWPFT